MGKKKTAAAQKKKESSLNQLTKQQEREDEGEEFLEDFTTSVSPFLFSSGAAPTNLSVFPALNVMPPQVLFYTPEECMRQCRGGRKMVERDKVMHKKVNLLMMTLFARSSFMSTRWAPFLSAGGNGGVNGKRGNKNDPFGDLGHSHHHPNCPCNGGNGPYMGFGARLYAHMLNMKNRLMTSPQYIADGDADKPYDERLANFWHQLDGTSRAALVNEEMQQLKSLLAWDSQHESSIPMFRTWCTCTVCLHRRVGIKDLVEQLHRAFWEELVRFSTVSKPLVADEDHAQSRSRRSLYRNLAIMCRSLLQARSRPVLDVINEYAGLKFNDHPPYYHVLHTGNEMEKSDSEDEYETDDSENDNCSCCCDGVFIEDLDPYGFENEPEEDMEDGADPFLDTLDYSDDEEMLESTNDLDVPMEEAHFITPVITAASLSKAEEQKLVEEGAKLFRLFASELFHHRLVLGYLQKATLDRQMRLLAEEEEEERKQKERDAAKQEAKRKKKERQRQSKQLINSQDDTNVDINEQTDHASLEEINTKRDDEQKENIDPELEITQLQEERIKYDELAEILSASDLERDLLLKYSPEAYGEQGENEDEEYEALYEQVFSKNAILANDLESELIANDIGNSMIPLEEDDEVDNLFKRLDQELKLLQSFVEVDPVVPPGFETKVIKPPNEAMAYWWSS